MRILALDTSTADLVVGVVDPDPAVGALAERIIEGTRAHNEQLMPAVEEALGSAGLAYSDLAAVVVGCGPGPFTGLRVGMSTASALAHALGVPVYGVCSHDATAWEMWAAGVRGEVLVAEDARRKEIYWSCFRITDQGVQRSAGPDVVRPEEVLEHNPELAGVDYISIPNALRERLPEQLLRGPQLAKSAPRPQGLVRAAGIEGSDAVLPSDPQPLVPLYLRRPDAKEPKPKPKSAAIPDVDLS